MPKSKEAPKSRYKKMGEVAELPPIEYGQHLIEALYACGPTDREGSPVSWQELESWSRMTRRTLTGWEAETVHKMSEAYAVQAIHAKEPNCLSPWKPIELPTSALNDKIKAMLGGRKKAPPKENKLAQKIPRN